MAPPVKSNTQQFLENTNVPITNQDTVASLRAKLRQIFNVPEGERSNFSNKFLQALLAQHKVTIGVTVSLNIKPIYIKYPWGTQLRFIIPGQRGLYGLAAVNRYIQSKA